MKQYFFVAAIQLAFILPAAGQLNKQSLHGVWRICAMPMGRDSFEMLKEDTGVARAFPALSYTMAEDIIERMTNATKKKIHLKINDNLTEIFMQFDSIGTYISGDEFKSGQGSQSNRGTFTVDGNKININTMDPEQWIVELKGRYMLVRSKEGFDYFILRKISEYMH